MNHNGRLISFIVLVCCSCIDLSSDPHEIIAIAFADLPWPSVVAGDTLRDESGHATPLTARLIDASGAEVTGTSIQFISRDTTVSVTPAGFVVAGTDTGGTARLLASAAGLQSDVRQIFVVPRPDSLAKQGTIDTLRYATPDSPVNVSGDLSARVVARTSPTAITSVRSWIVRYTMEYQGIAIAPGDTSKVFLVDATGRPSVVDTTDAQGAVSRRVRFRAVPGNSPALDSIIVTVDARYKGVHLAGSPVRLVLPVKPKT